MLVGVYGSRCRKQFFLYLAVIVHTPSSTIIANAIDATTEANPTSESPDPSESNPDLSVALEGNCFAACDIKTMSSKKQAQRRLAFSVVKKDNFRRHFRSEPRVVMFDNLLLNHGNAFDMTSGTFIASSSGTYSFQFAIFKNLNRNPVTVALTVNGAAAFTGFAYIDDVKHDVAQNSGLIQLNEGDRVRLEVREGELDGGWQYSTFSGFLLYEEVY